MIVIYEQWYDVVSMLDIIDDDKFDEYVEHYRKQLLDKPHVVSILKEKDIHNSYSYQLKYNYEGGPVEWEGFYYAKFDKTNNFKK